MTAATDVTLDSGDLDEAASKLPSTEQDTSDAVNAMDTMEKLPGAGSDSDTAGQASLADANAARNGGGAAGGGGGGGCGGGAAGGAAGGGAGAAGGGADAT
jgi:phosphate transport system substrate-binding protein